LFQSGKETQGRDQTIRDFFRGVEAGFAGAIHQSCYHMVMQGQYVRVMLRPYQFILLLLGHHLPNMFSPNYYAKFFRNYFFVQFAKQRAERTRSAIPTMS
jgi:hypothetical protein